MTDGKKALPVVAAVIVKGNAFFICRRPDDKALAGYWEFPGGKVEPGEKEEEALRREIREELGCAVRPQRLFCRVRHDYPDFSVDLAFYLCRIERGEPKLLEHREARWIAPDDIPRFAFCPADEGVLEKIRRELR